MALGRAARVVQRVVGIDLGAELLRLRPLLALAARQREELGREQLEALDVAPLGIDLQQLGANREALGVAAHRLLENLLGLQIAAVGEIDVGFGHRIDVADRIELRQRVRHRRRAAAGIARVDALAATGAEERVGLQAALEERRFAAVLLRALREAIDTEARQQDRESAETEVERFAQQGVEQAGRGLRLGRRARRRACRHHGAGSRRGHSWRGTARGAGRGHDGRRSADDGRHRGRDGRSGSRGREDRRDHRRRDDRGRRCRLRHGCGCKRRCGRRGSCHHDRRRRCRRTSPGHGRRHRGGSRCRRCRALDLLQVVQVLVQLGDPGIGGLTLALLRNLVFGNRRWRTLGRRSGTLAQGQLVRRWRGGRLAIFHRGLDLAGCLASAGLGLGRQGRAGETLPIGAEVGALRHDRLARLGGADGLRRLGGRNREDDARFQAIHVLAHERARIGAEQRHQHLVERDTFALRARGDLREGVAGMNLNLVRVGARACTRTRRRSAAAPGRGVGSFRLGGRGTRRITALTRRLAWRRHRRSRWRQRLRWRRCR